MNKIVMNRKKLTVIVLAAVTVVFLFSGFLVPVGIVAEPTATLYEYEALTENDFKVETRTLFGVRKEVPEFSMSTIDAENIEKPGAAGADSGVAAGNRHGIHIFQREMDNEHQRSVREYRENHLRV